MLPAPEPERLHVPPDGGVAMAAKAPWGMRPDETAKAYQAFEIYRDLGPDRSLERAGAALAKSRQALLDMGAALRLAARVRAFDEYVASRAADKAVETTADSSSPGEARSGDAASGDAEVRGGWPRRHVGGGGNPRVPGRGGEVERKVMGGSTEKVIVLRRDEVGARGSRAAHRRAAAPGGDRWQSSRLLEAHDRAERERLAALRAALPVLRPVAAKASLSEFIHPLFPEYDQQPFHRLIVEKLGGGAWGHPAAHAQHAAPAR